MPAHTKQHNKKISENSAKYWLGKHLSAETKQKLSESNKGHIPWNKGKIDVYSEKTKEKMRIAGTGRLHTEKAKAKIKAYQNTDKAKKRASDNGKKNIGEKNAHWKGGITFEVYPVDWTQTLKKSIRERDKYVCQICSKQQEDKAHCVHHIDYDKKNCNPNNLITLCNDCHLKTNVKREYWTNYFQQKMEVLNGE